MEEEYNNLGKIVCFFIDGEKEEGQVIGIHKSVKTLEETPAWRKTDKTFRYMVDVISCDLGYVWINHNEIIQKNGTKIP